MIDEILADDAPLLTSGDTDATIALEISLALLLETFGDTFLIISNTAAEDIGYVVRLGDSLPLGLTTATELGGACAT